MFKEKYKPWELLPHLTFLEDQIIPRKSNHFKLFHQINDSKPNYYPEKDSNESKKDEYSCMGQNATLKKEDISDNSNFNMNEKEIEKGRSDFDKALVDSVKQSSSLWDSKHENFSDKRNRKETWDLIGKKLLKTSHECMVRWKGLREKYIREKSKKRGNKDKWELLETMSFLDQVIQYRKTSRTLGNEGIHQDVDAPFGSLHGDFLFSGESSTSNDYHYQVIAEENSLHDTTRNLLMEVKQEHIDIPDSCYDSEGSSKKRRLSTNSCCSIQKQRVDKSPEHLFGELVASLLSRKSASDKNAAMVEIMKVLAK
ncbi:hypothetical protein HHI36_002882 [Cryptolaemus montrouzieri]|uniref:MADF domain-containing protein n=1 Tax=Cryptolaemus montrouzieri TaxID=559131 RepID=A0ABD2PCB5_9CUCU